MISLLLRRNRSFYLKHSCIGLSKGFYGRLLSHSKPITTPNLKTYGSSTSSATIIEDVYLQEEGGPKSIQTTSSYREKLSLVEACILTAQYKRASLIFNKLVADYPRLSSKLLDSSIFNTYLEAVLKNYNNTSNSLLKESMLWFSLIRKHGLDPDMKSYSLLIKSALLSNCSQMFLSSLVSDFIKVFSHARFNEFLSTFFDNDPRHHSSLVQVYSSLFPLDPFIPPPSSPPSDIKESPSDNLKFVQMSIQGVQSVHESPEAHQLYLEQSTFRINLDRLESISEKKKDYSGIGILPPRFSKIVLHWMNNMNERLVQELQSCKSELSNVDRLDYGPFLLLFESNPQMISAAVLSQFLKHSSHGQGNILASELVFNIGKSVEQEYLYMTLSKKEIREKIFQNYKNSLELVKNKKLFRSNVRKLKALAASNDDSIFGIEWGQSTIAKVGSVLAAMFVDCAKIPLCATEGSLVFESKKLQSNDVRWEPAFSHGKYMKASRLYGCFTVHPELQKAIEGSVKYNNHELSDDVVKGLIMPKLLPMVVPPKPWITYNSGGYLSIRTVCMRAATKEQEMYLKSGSLDGKLNKIFSGLDVLGQTKWRVNEALLEHMIKAWNTGKEIAGFSEEISSKFIDLPKPDDFESDPIVRKNWLVENNSAKQKYFDLKSRRATENYRLEIAKAFKGMPIYFPQSLDFRGRVYPIPQLFNHIGNDISRSLLIFDRPKPLGENGFHWLKIHLANCYGYDKCNFEERLSFVHSNVENILESARDPFGSSKANGWWLKGDKPWMTLASCIEISNVVNSGLGISLQDKFSAYESRMPVHQDGSCNGLQHYAALGGDVDGAKQVNVINCGDTKQDVYMEVATRVKQMVMDDLKYEPKSEELLESDTKLTHAQLSLPHVKYHLAKLLTPERVERKIVKQTVMTSVYGVTMAGARDQIFNRLKEKYIPDVYSVEQAQYLANYLTAKTFQALDSMFANARKIQEWLASSAKEVARSVCAEDLEKLKKLEEQLKKWKKTQNTVDIKKYLSKLNLNSKSPVIWTTPLGLTVVQPYRNVKGRMIHTPLQNFSIMDTGLISPVNVQRQSTAFPPNFVHSLDATHMIMTALACANRNEPIDFASVHDSYWTHACDVDTLRGILKEEFVNLHSSNILEKLYEEFKTRYSERKVLNTYKTQEAAKKLKEMSGGGFKYKYNKKDKVFVIDTAQNDGSRDMDSKETEGSQRISDLENGFDEKLGSDVDGDMGLEEESVPIQDEGNENQDDNYWFTQLAVSPSRKFIRVWENVSIPPLPKKGSLDLEAIKNSKYFFS